MSFFTRLSTLLQVREQGQRSEHTTHKAQAPQQKQQQPKQQQKPVQQKQIQTQKPVIVDDTAIREAQARARLLLRQKAKPCRSAKKPSEKFGSFGKK